MIHQRQRLPLGLKSRDDCARVHAELDDFDGDFAPQRLYLCGAINDAAAALANFFEDLITGKRIGFVTGCRNNFVCAGIAFQTKLQQAAQAQPARHVRRERRAALRTFELAGHFSVQQVSKAKRARKLHPTGRLSARQNREQVPDFRFHFFRLGHGVSHFLAQQFAKPTAQAVQGNFQRAVFLASCAARRA